MDPRCKTYRLIRRSSIYGENRGHPRAARGLTARSAGPPKAVFGRPSWCPSAPKRSLELLFRCLYYAPSNYPGPWVALGKPIEAVPRCVISIRIKIPSRWRGISHSAIESSKSKYGIPGPFHCRARASYRTPGPTCKNSTLLNMVN